jgi:uncharacterized protein (DUF2249 family)
MMTKAILKTHLHEVIALANKLHVAIFDAIVNLQTRDKHRIELMNGSASNFLSDNLSHGNSHHFNVVSCPNGPQVSGASFAFDLSCTFCDDRGKHIIGFFRAARHETRTITSALLSS